MSTKVEGIKEFLEIFDDKIILSPKDNYSLDTKTLIFYEQIFKIDFESAGKFTHGFIHFILKDKLNKNVFSDIQKNGCIFLFDYLDNNKMFDVKQAIVKKISGRVSSQGIETDTGKMIKNLTDLNDLYQKGALSKKKYDQQMKELIKKM